MDEIVIFNNLNKKELYEIAKIEFKNLEKRINKRNLSLKVDNDAFELLINRSFDHIYGARPLKKVIKNEIETAIANKILENHYVQKNDVEIFVKNGNIEVN